MVDVVKLDQMGLRGEGFADTARRLGSIDGIAVSPTATDAEVLTALADSQAAALDPIRDEAVAAAAASAADRALAEAAAAQALAVVALGSRSIQFPDASLQFTDQFGLIKQSLTNFGAMDAVDGDWGIILRLPHEKTHQNRAYTVFGNVPGSNPARFSLTYYGTDHNSAGNRGRFVWQHRQNGGAGNTMTALSEVIPMDGTYDCLVLRRAKVGTTWTIDVWDCATGTKLAGTGVTDAGVGSIAAGTYSQTHFYIGWAGDTASEPTRATAFAAPSSGFVGEIEAIWYTIANGSDANYQNIALGAVPTTEIGITNFRYYRRFLGTDATSLAPVAGTVDATSAATVLGLIKAGSNIRRQAADTYLTLDYLPDGYVFGLQPGEQGRRILYAGSVAGSTGHIEGRFVLPDGTPLVPWTKIATISGGTFSGYLDVPKTPKSGGYREIRVANNTSLTWLERSRIGVGIKVALVGQSQAGKMMGGGYQAGAAAGMSRKLASGGWGSFACRASDLSVILREQIRVFDGQAAWSDGVAAMIDRIADVAGCPVQICNYAVDGSSALEWIKTAGTRLWSDGVSLAALAGDDISCANWQWYTSHQSQGNNFGTNILDPVIRGFGTNSDTHWIGDGTLWRRGHAVVISSFTRTSETTAGPFDFDKLTTGGIPEARKAARDWADTNGYAKGPYINDMRIDGSGGPHELLTSVYGGVRLGIREAESTLRAMGMSRMTDPVLSSPTFTDGTKVAFTVTCNMPNGGKLRTDDTATYDANVQGFEISTDGGTIWSRSGFTAAISTTASTRNKVTITKSAGSWTTLQVRYCWGGAFAYGTSTEATELFRGGLYDGTDLESGLGIPVAPLAATVVA